MQQQRVLVQQILSCMAGCTHGINGDPCGTLGLVLLLVQFHRWWDGWRTPGWPVLPWKRWSYLSSCSLGNSHILMLSAGSTDRTTLEPDTWWCPSQTLPWVGGWHWNTVFYNYSILFPPTCFCCRIACFCYCPWCLMAICFTKQKISTKTLLQQQRNYFSLRWWVYPF